MQPTAAQPEIASDFALKVKEYQGLFESHAVPFGAPDNLGPLLQKLHADPKLATDFWALTETICRRDRTACSFSELFTLIAISICGPTLQASRPDVHQGLQELSTLLAAADEGSAGATGKTGHDDRSPLVFEHHTEPILNRDAPSAPGISEVLRTGETQPAAAPYPAATRSFNEALARLELSSIEITSYLDSIEGRMSRMEPRLGGTGPPVSEPMPNPHSVPAEKNPGEPASSGNGSLEAEEEAEAEASGAFPVAPHPHNDEPLRHPGRRKQDISAESSPGRFRRRKSDFPRQIAYAPLAGRSEFTTRSSDNGPVTAELQGEILPTGTSPWLLRHRLALLLAFLPLVAGVFAILLRGRSPSTLHPTTQSLNANFGAHFRRHPPAAPQKVEAPNRQNVAHATHDEPPGTHTVVSADSGAPAVANKPPDPSAASPGLPPTVSSPTEGNLPPTLPTEHPLQPNIPAPVPAAAPSHHGRLSFSAGNSIFGNPRRINVSSGVMAANLIVAPPPIYPKFASLTDVQGAVVLQAIISRRGTIEHVHIIKGHHLLRGAASDAVRRWRYRPYLVDGRPVEVATIITVDFSIHH